VWLAAKPYVQQLSFFIVLTRAGLELSPQDLNVTAILLGTVPVLSTLSFLYELF
jgi:hypothetical protein